jgi:putative nucleotidyltransferase with HDIG domain
MHQEGMPRHILRHSLVVTQIAVFLGRRLNDRRHTLDLAMVEAGALLHDIAKARSLVTGEQHHKLGAQKLNEWGYPAIAAIVEDHVSLDRHQLAGPLTESLLVNYADKRVMHDAVVPLEDRFKDLMVRYARTTEHRSRLRSALLHFLDLERRIFIHLEIHPSDVSQLSLTDQKRGET